MEKIRQTVKRILILLIYLYRYGISSVTACNCRYEPTCSEYMQQAINIHGCLRGVYLGFRRLIRCHPWHSGGYDPVPKDKG